MTVRIFTSSQLIIQTKEGLMEVKPFNKNSKLKKGFGYLHDGMVYVYRGKPVEFQPNQTGIFKIKGEYKFRGDEVDSKGIYDVEDIMELEPEAIYENLEEEPDDFVRTDELETVSNAREIYVPVIKESDDFLKTGIKKVIADKKINLKKKYRTLYNESNDLSNMASTLKGKTKMTTPKFLDWANILDVSWELRIYDNGKDKLNPLKEDIVITSEEY